MHQPLGMDLYHMVINERIKADYLIGASPWRSNVCRLWSFLPEASSFPSRPVGSLVKIGERRLSISSNGYIVVKKIRIISTPGKSIT